MSTVKALLGLALAVPLWTPTTIAAPIPIAFYDFESESGPGIAAGSTASYNKTVRTTILDGFDTGDSAADIAGFGGTDPFTIVATIQAAPEFRLLQPNPATNPSAYGTIFAYSPTAGSGAGRDLRLYVRADGGYRVEVSNGAFEVAGGGAVPNLGDGAVHTIAFLKGAGELVNDVDLYVDGVLFPNTTTGLGGAAANRLIDIADPTGTSAYPTITIGNDRGIGSVTQTQAVDRDFLGLIDDVAIYGQVLTLAELDAIRADGISAPVPEPTSLAIVLAAIGLVALRRKS